MNSILKTLGVLHALALVTAGTFVTTTCLGTDITGAGSTFVFPVLSKWSAAYKPKTGIGINYQSIGSGGGIAQIKAGTVDFGATDKPLEPDELDKAGLAQFPVVIGGIVPVVNLPNIKPGQLHFTGPLLADLFLGKVKKWNDPAIKEVNPDVNLPGTTINIVHRSDGSGTTFNWTNYLSKVSPDWKSKVGEGTAVSWPTGTGGKGNEGVSAFVQRIPGSIGYVEYAYALQNKMNYGLVKNSAGKFVEPNVDSFSAAAANAKWADAKHFYLILTDAPGDTSWPIAATTWVLLHREPKDASRTKQVLDFFRWAFTERQDDAKALDYVPLPDSLVKLIEDYWKTEIKL
jgi:phosphate transport system substrate-binding protein